MIKITLECEHNSISECKDCPISVFNKFNKLLDYVKDCAQLEFPAGCFVSEADQYVLDARSLLKEIGEIK